jgi:hypothetical protein
MTQRVTAKTFSGNARLYDGTLADIIQKMSMTLNHLKMRDIADLTDNSGGATADGTIDAIPIATLVDVNGTNLCSKTAMDTALGEAKAAIQELGAKLSAMYAVVTPHSLTNNLGGTNDGTIGAITKSFTAVDTAGVHGADFNTAITAIRNSIATLAKELNYLCYACGVDKLVDNSGGTAAINHTLSALTVTTGNAGTTNSVSKTDGDAIMSAVAAAVKELATKMNSLIAASTYVACDVVAVEE